ncbi:MAG TPA: hypothetical protein EYQ50_29080 [Verrucomicrobiales bacterium]|nr:hypothetical protein [Verrucomicrobiales bacterium]
MPLVFLAGFLLTAVVSRAVLQNVEMIGWIPWFFQDTDHIPLESESYLAYENGGLDHLVLFHQLDDSIAHARDVDVLILGNSRALYGFPQMELKRFQEKTGLKVFNLSFSWGEKMNFPLKIIQKFQLNPKYVIVNTDGFFDPESSIGSIEAFALSRWAARKRVFEKQSSWELRQRIHRILPKFYFNTDPPYRIIYRSPMDGSWLPLSGPDQDVPVHVWRNPYWKMSSLTVNSAEQFLSQIGLPRSSVILTLVPYPGHDDRLIKQLAETTGLPTILYSESNLRSNDGSHLDSDSGIKFATYFFREFSGILEGRPQ